MKLLIAFLILAAVGGQFSRSFDWRLYAVIGAFATLATAAYYFNSGLW